MLNQDAKTCVFYDGACSLCRKEINYYKALDSKHSDKSEIDWIDISLSQDELFAEGIKYKDAMQLLHVKDGTGVHQVGIQGVFTLWDGLPYYRRLSALLRRIPFSHLLLGKAYVLFAKNRMKLTGRLRHD